MLVTIALLAAAQQPVHCLTPRRELVDRTRKAPMRRLGELPPAEAYLAVYHTRDGCLVPVKVRDRR